MIWRTLNCWINKSQIKCHLIFFFSAREVVVFFTMDIGHAYSGVLLTTYPFDVWPLGLSVAREKVVSWLEHQIWVGYIALLDLHDLMTSWMRKKLFCILIINFEECLFDLKTNDLSWNCFSMSEILELNWIVKKKISSGFAFSLINSKIVFLFIWIETSELFRMGTKNLIPRFLLDICSIDIVINVHTWSSYLPLLFSCCLHLSVCLSDMCYWSLSWHSRYVTFVVCVHFT